MSNIYQKINNINKVITTVLKDSEVSMGGNRSYAAVSHDAVTNLLHLPLAKEGIVVIPSITNTVVSSTEHKEQTQYGEKIRTTYRADVSVSITFVNCDDPSDSFACSAFAYALDTGDKAVGKAYSMAVKNAYLKVFMLESVDEEEARHTEPNTTYKQKTAPVVAPQAAAPQKPVNHAPGTSGGALSEAQVKRYWGMAKALGWSKEDCETNISQNTGGRTKSLKDITRDEYTIITAKMQAGIDNKNQVVF